MKNSIIKYFDFKYVSVINSHFAHIASLFIVLGFWWGGANADLPPCTTTNSIPNTWYDQSHDYLSQKFCEPTVWFDNFFSNERSDEERSAGSFVRWRNEFFFSEQDGSTMSSQLSANVTLPHATKRLHLLLMREDEEETISTLTDNVKPNPNPNPNDNFSFQRRDFNVGLRYDLSEELLSHFSISGGIRGGTPLKPFVKGRYRYTHPLSNYSLLRLIETVYWKNTEGIGETTRLELERQLSNETVLRWSNNATYSELSIGVDLGSDLSLFKQLSERSAISFTLGAWGYTRPNTLTSVGISSRYRRNFYRRWLFYEIEPIISWARDELGERTIIPSVTFRVEVQFER